MKFFLVCCLLIFLLVLPTIDSISIKFRRWCSPWKFCSLTKWKEWGPCDKSCGGGVRTRYRQMCSLPVIDFTQHVAVCNRKMSDFIQYENCSQICSNYGQWSNSSQKCQCTEQGITDSCCMTDLGRWSKWSSWSECQGRCGNYGLRNRTRFCLWKDDLLQRDSTKTNCVGDPVEYESCFKLCDRPEDDEAFFDELPSNQTVSIGGHVRFVCKPKSGTIKWFINNEDASFLSLQNPSIKQISSGKILFIFPVTNFFSNESRIVCRNNFPSGEFVEREVFMLIDSSNDESEKLDEKQCGLTKSLESIYFVRYGSSFSIECQPRNSDGEVFWRKNSLELPTIDDKNIEILSSTILLIKSVDFRHNATFSCSVETKSRCKISSTWILFVFESIRQVSESVTANPLNFVGTNGFAVSGSTPWHVTVSYRDLVSNFHYDSFCSGLIIDEETILSVSQCFDESSSLKIYLEQEKVEFDPRKLIVSVAKYDRTKPNEFERQISVLKIIESSKGVVILKVRLVFLSVESRPLNFATMNEIGVFFEKFELFVTGWGSLSANGQKSTRLKYVRQRFLQCNDSTNPMIFCATSFSEKQPNLCPGDIGGVLFAQNQRQIFALGLVSKLSKSFCDFRSSQIATILRLDTLSAWIRENSLN